jgi:hypothetical protein
MRLATILVPATALAVTALALTSPAQAAELKPKGSAVVGISGGTATAKALTNHRYTVTFPQESNVTWFGTAKDTGGAPRVGSFTPKQLVKGWKALGHRPGVGVAATLVWQAGDGESTLFVLASDPKVQSDGTLKMTVFTKQGLPAELPGYSVTVTRATKSARAFPVNGVEVQVSGSVYFSTQATSATTTSGKIYSGSTKCMPYSLPLSSGKAYTFVLKCSDVTFNDGSAIQLYKAASGQCGYDRLTAVLGTGRNMQTYYFISAYWDVNGNAVTAGSTCS